MKLKIPKYINTQRLADKIQVYLFRPFEIGTTSKAMYLRPSNIRFSQDSVGRTSGCYTFNPNRPIGEMLDDTLKKLM